MTPEKKRWIIVGLLCLLPFLGWWTYGLFDVDEGFYGAVTAEMNRRGGWITPLYNGSPWYEKPILLYWAAKPMIALFGPNFGPRLPSILSSMGTCWLVAWYGRKRFGTAAGQIAPLLLATSLIFVATGRMMLVDPLLILALSGSQIFFWESLVGNPRWRLLSAGLLGAAVLAKGPVSCVFFALTATWTFYREPELRPKFKGYWFTGTLVFSAVVATWYLPAYLVDRDVFVQKFIIEQNIQRFRGGDEAHAVPMPAGLIYFFVVLLVGMAPWSFFVWKAWPKKAFDEARNVDPLSFLRYCAAWASVVFLFFTISGTKLPHYILPCLPPLALLLSHFFAIRWQGFPKKRLIIVGVGSSAMCLFANAGFYGYYQSFHAEVHQIAWFIKDKPPHDVALFRLSKQEGGNSEKLPSPRIFGIQAGLNETTHPSLLLYLDRDVVDTDKVDALVTAPHPIWIITRAGRFGTQDVAQLAEAGLELDPIQTPFPQVYYRLYELAVRKK